MDVWYQINDYSYYNHGQDEFVALREKNLANLYGGQSIFGMYESLALNLGKPNLIWKFACGNFAA